MDNSKESRQSSFCSNSVKAKPIHTFFLVMICSLGLMITSCSDNSTGSTGGNGGNGGNGGGDDDDTPTEPTYSNVQDIFNGSCGGSNCHLSSPQSGVQLDNYDNTMSSEGVQYGQLVVQEGDASSSPLVDKIESSNPAEGERMPQGGPYLSTDEIDLIKEWIDEGAEDN
jgi:hypothetical protein